MIRVSIVTILLLQCILITLEIPIIISYSFTLLYSLLCIKCFNVKPYFVQNGMRDKKLLYVLILTFAICIFCSIMYIVKQTCNFTIMYVLNILGIHVYASFVEEVLFRKFMLNIFYRIMKSKWRAIIINSIIFGCIHIITICDYNPQLIMGKVFITFCIGVVLSDIYIRTESVFAGSIFHSIYNVTITLGALEPKVLYFCIIEIIFTWSFIITFSKHIKRRTL